jgi:hypothetical protein
MTNVDVFALLLTVAQIAVAFAGFGAIANGMRPRGAQSPIDAHQLRTMVESSVLVMVFALTPWALALFELPDASVWRGSAILFLIGLGIAFPGWLKRVRGVRKIAGFPVQMLLVGISVLAVSLVMFALCAFGAPIAGNFAATYFAGLFPYLLVEGLLFSRLILSFLTPPKPD